MLHCKTSRPYENLLITHLKICSRKLSRWGFSGGVHLAVGLSWSCHNQYRAVGSQKVLDHVCGETVIPPTAKETLGVLQGRMQWFCPLVCFEAGSPVAWACASALGALSIRTLHVSPSAWLIPTFGKRKCSKGHLPVLRVGPWSLCVLSHRLYLE